MQVTLQDLVQRGTRLRAEEAVAVVIAVGERLGWSTAPPAPDRITLSSAGSVEVAPFEPEPQDARAYAQLLHLLLPDTAAGGAFQVPGALRLAVARGIGAIDLPPFASAAAFGSSVRRFVTRTPAALVAALVERTAATAEGGEAPVAAPAGDRSRHAVERRRNAPRVDVLRRLLHEADLERFELLEARRAIDAHPKPLPSERRPDGVQDLHLRLVPKAEDAAPQAGRGDQRPRLSAPVPALRRRAATAAAAALALLLSFAGSYAIVRHLHQAQQAGDVPSAEARRAPTLQWVPGRAGDGGPDAGADDSAGAASGAGENGPPPGGAREDGDRGAGASTALATPAAARMPAVSRLARAHALPVNEVRTYSPSFTPEGDGVYFHADAPDGSRLLRADIDPRGQVTSLHTVLEDGARNYHVRVSPDGQRIAFDSDRDGERAVFVARADGTDVTRVSAPGTYAAVPAWTPDGRTLAFLRAERGKPRVWNLWARGVDGGPERRLTQHASGQAWPGDWFDDGRLAYTHEDRLHILDTTTGRRTSFASPRRGRLVRTAAVAPEGQRIVFQVHRDGTWLLDLRDGSMRRVLDDPSAEEFAWAPSGTHVAYHSRRAGPWRVWMAPVAQTP
jgi:hypothetical protein